MMTGSMDLGKSGMASFGIRIFWENGYPKNTQMFGKNPKEEIFFLPR
jgi:hypothetical protein